MRKPNLEPKRITVTTTVSTKKTDGGGGRMSCTTFMILEMVWLFEDISCVDNKRTL